MRYVLAVARTGHFGRAAEACAVSQPALSQQIQALEQVCGAALFDRLKSGAVLTPFGRDFVALAGEAVRHAEAVDAFALRHAGHPQRAVRFGLIPTVAPYLLPDIFPRLIAHLPQMQFAISESRTEALLGGIAEGTLDLALIATEPPEGARLVAEPLFDDPFVLAAPSDAAPEARSRSTPCRPSASCCSTKATASATRPSPPAGWMPPAQRAPLPPPRSRPSSSSSPMVRG